MTKTRIGRRVAPPAMHSIGSGYSLFCYNVCHFFDAVQATCSKQMECGGILIGSFRGPHIQVSGYTEPGPKDIASFSSFTRVDERHQHAAMDAWRRSNNTTTYVGEWHSHPSGPPHPSDLDRQTWKTVVARLNTPCLFIIVSPIGWQVFHILRAKSLADVVPLTRLEEAITGIVYG